MKTYLDLVPLSARAHRKQNRMTVFCIVLAVFLVTAIFGMADMFIRSQVLQAQREYGNWHISLRDISDEDARQVAARSDVKCVSCYGILNYRGEDGYTLGGKPVAIMGSEESLLTLIQQDAIAEGTFPTADSEAMVSLNVKRDLGLETGDRITISLPDGGSRELTVTGFINNTANLMSEDSYGVSMTTAGYRALCPAAAGGSPADYNSVFFVQFANAGRIQSSIDSVKTQLGLDDGQTSENTQLMALLGQGSSSFTLQIYGAAAVLFVLVLLAGVMMITSSLNSSVAGRTQFYGMMRCIGASKKQVVRLVRAEALSWCASAIPLGIAGGVVLTWGLCLLLRLLSPDYFGAMPAFGISLPSLLAGFALGLLTVLCAARAPARRAARVSPLAAASGNADTVRFSGRAADTGRFRIDTALGVQHARGSRKNYILMSGSFALSIILFLSFSVTIGFMEHALTPLSPWTPDLSVASQDGGELIPAGMIESVGAMAGVERVYGRMAANDLPAETGGAHVSVHLISYEDNQFAWAEDYLLEGSVADVRDRPGTGMAVYVPDGAVSLGSVITLDAGGGSAPVTIAAILSDSPFSTNDGGIIVICSENTLRQSTGVDEYAVMDIQLCDRATDAEVDGIRSAVGAGYTFADERMSNSSVRGAYYSFGLFIYGFLALIAMVTVFNIVNSIAMSAEARTRQYGVLRAIGLSAAQLANMISAEAVTYTVTGTVFGTVIGLGLNRLLFQKIISYNWGDAWRFPTAELAVIFAVIALSVVLAVRKPVRRIRNMSIVETISAL